MSKQKSSKKPDELAQQVAELTNALKHERADADNMRRRHEQQISELRDMVKINVLNELLPALDNLDRALTHAPKELKDNDYVKGVQSVAKQFEKTLSEMGITKIKTVGEVFDPNLHEAVHMDEGDGEVEVICEELQPGYTLGNQVIRHAMVKVKKESRK